MPEIPSVLQQWFDRRDWEIRNFQYQVLEKSSAANAIVLIAPTGAGKTLSGFLPALCELATGNTPPNRLHTLYISPLKALTQDIHRNLLIPIDEMSLPINVETRTGDTPAHKRQRQRRQPPHILLTTPESLMLMLSYTDAAQLFSSLRYVIIDELHGMLGNKRGDFTSLALAQLSYLAPQLVRIGLSATLANPTLAAQWLGTPGYSAELIEVSEGARAQIRLLESRERLPFAGHSAAYAAADLYQAVKMATRTLLFVNTRAQAERLFQLLWEVNKDGLPIALYHGSLSVEQRRKTEQMMAAGQLRAIVATSALELGIDWNDLDQVIQVGAPKGVSRLLQRIGRSNHRWNEASVASLLPANRFEVVECVAAIDAIQQGQLDMAWRAEGAWDVLPQFIMNCACERPVTPQMLYQRMVSATPYAHLDYESFLAIWEFTCFGGAALRHYDRYRRLLEQPGGHWVPASKTVVQRHRQNVGTIVEAAKLRVKRLKRGNQGTIIGEVEEYFAQQLTLGDTFVIAGEVLAFEAIRDMQVHAWPTSNKDAKIPSFVGGQLPLSTFLAEQVRHILSSPERWSQFPEQVREWLQIQREFSQIPQSSHLLVEQFPRQGHFVLILYTFDGRKANQTLGMLLTKRMEKEGLKPLSFSVTDYGLAINTLRPVSCEQSQRLVNPDILGDELADWMLQSPMLKRAFRQVAVVSGLIEQHYHSTHKSMKQVTFSTDLIYDTLRQHEPDHVLLQMTRREAETELLDLPRLTELLIRYNDRQQFVDLPGASPLSLPIIYAVRNEQVQGSAAHTLLDALSIDNEAEQVMADIKDFLRGGH